MHPLNWSRRHGRSRPARARLAALALTGALLVLPACAGTRGGEEGSQSARPAARVPTTLVVENRGFPTMAIYVMRSGGQRIRLGLANGLSTTRFTIPANLIFGTTGLRFVADPIGSDRAPVSNEINVAEGDEVSLVINP